MLAERSVIIATTPGTRSLPVTTFCKIASHALFKLLFIDVPPIEMTRFDPASSRQTAAGPRGTMSTGVTYGSRAPHQLSQSQLRNQKCRSGRRGNSNWRFDHAVAPGHYRDSTER